VRRGHSGVPVVRSKNGIGNTALLDRLAEAAVDSEIVRERCPDESLLRVRRAG
jgi:hypothetical protein